MVMQAESDAPVPPGEASIPCPSKTAFMAGTVAVDLGATRTRVAIRDAKGRTTDPIEEPTPSGGADGTLLTGFLAGMIRRLLESGKLSGIDSIGLSVAGPVDIRAGILKNPPNMQFRDVPIRDTLSREFSVPVRVVNDCHAGILGELSFGKAGGRQNAVYITISTGIGCGVVANGRILLGRHGNAAEIGHFHVDSTYNLQCGCGHSGHWEGYSSGRFLPWFFQEWCHYHGKAHWGSCNAEDIFQSAQQGDDDVLRFVDELNRINARGVSDVIVAYDPELIIFDGAVMRHNSDLLLEPMIDSVDRYLDLPEIVMTGLSGDAPLLGASVIAGGLDTAYGSFTAMTDE